MAKIQQVLQLLCLLMVAGTVQSSQQAITAAADQITRALTEGGWSPVVSESGNITTADAYEIQHIVVTHSLQGTQPSGFKAGLTSKAAQNKFAVNHPIAGVLLPYADQYTNDGRVKVVAEEFHNTMMEAEIGFRLNTRVTETIVSIETLKAMVAQVLPVVELPDMSFENPKLATGIDLIAHNVMAKQFIPGSSVAMDEIELEDLTIQIMKDGDMILEGSSDDAMGDQLTALLWLINQTVEHGWTIEPGQLLLTGALGRMIPAKPGFYQVDYGALGQIDFLVE